MATRLTFLCAAATASSRTGAFPTIDDPLDDGGRRKAMAFDCRQHGVDLVVSSPSRSAVETADALGLAARIEPLVADLNFGAWAGRTLTDLAERAPDRLGEWLADPTRPVPDGESLDDLVRRVGGWIDDQADAGAATLIITHASVMRAALSHALAIPPAYAIRIDVAPLTTLRLSYNGQWRLQELRRSL
jgi:broad specificity phosphatase PhoE